MTADIIKKLEALTLVEKIAVIMAKARANEVFFEQAAEAILATVYEGLSEPTREMWAGGGTAAVDTRNKHHDTIAGAVWQAMLNASPLAGEKL